MTTAVAIVAGAVLGVVLGVVFEYKSIVAKIRYEIAVANSLRASAKKAAVADLQDVTADIEDLAKKA